MTLDDIRRFAVSRSLFMPTTLERDLPPAGFAFREFRTFERAAEKLPIKTKVVARLGETLVEEEK